VPDLPAVISFILKRGKGDYTRHLEGRGRESYRRLRRGRLDESPGNPSTEGGMAAPSYRAAVDFGGKKLLSDLR